MRSILLTLFICAISVTSFAQVLPSFGDSRTATTGMQFLKVAVDARAAAMSGAVCATVADPSAMYWNPAGITHVDTGKVVLLAAHTRYFADTKVNYLGAVFKPGKQSFVGVQIQSLDYGQMMETIQ